MTLKNEIKKYEKQDTLFEGPEISNQGNRKQLYLVARFGDDGYVKIETRVSERISTYHYFYEHDGTQEAYLLPDLVRPETLRDEVQTKIIPILEKINANTKIDWNRHGEPIDEVLMEGLHCQMDRAISDLPQYES